MSVKTRTHRTEHPIEKLASVWQEQFVAIENLSNHQARSDWRKAVFNSPNSDLIFEICGDLSPEYFVTIIEARAGKKNFCLVSEIWELEMDFYPDGKLINSVEEFTEAFIQYVSELMFSTLRVEIDRGIMIDRYRWIRTNDADLEIKRSWKLRRSIVSRKNRVLFHNPALR